MATRTGFGLSMHLKEREKLQAIADQRGVTPHSILLALFREFLQQNTPKSSD